MEKTIGFAKHLRKQATEVEKKLWQYLRAKRFYGLKFKRQQPLGHYIVDFICFSEQLVIELDGGQHAENTLYDQERDAWLAAQGYSVLRIWNHEVISNIEGVLAEIANYCGIGCPLSLTLSLKGRGD